MIALNKVEFSYDQRGISGLHQISFELLPGKIMAIMGPSGSGKSTLLKMIRGLLKPKSGEITVKGKVALLDRHQVLTKEKTLLQNLLDEKNNVEEARYWIAQFELTNEINRLVETLSGGQYQRALLAQSMMSNPSTLLIDEFFEQLDPLLRKSLWNDLLNIVNEKKISILWVGHLIEEVYLYADTLGILNFGSLIQLGSPSQIYHQPKSIFAAEFMGPVNLIPAKKISPDTLETALSLIKLTTPWDRDDAIIMVRPEAIKESETGLTGTLQSSQFIGGHYQNRWKINGQKLIGYSAKEISTKKNQISIDYSTMLLF